MEHGRNRSIHKNRKSESKRSDDFDMQNGQMTNGYVVPAIWDYSRLGSYFSMMNLKDMPHPKFMATNTTQQIIYSSPTVPQFTDFINYQSLFFPMNNQLQNKHHNRSHSLIQSDSNTSTTNGSRTSCSDESIRTARTNRPFSSAAVERPFKRMENLQKAGENHFPKNNRCTSSMSTSKFVSPAKTTSPILPSWSLDANGVLISDIPLKKVLESGELMKFAMDKAGCQYLQDKLKKNIPSKQKDMIFDQVFAKKELFMKLSTNMFGNFFIQQVIELAAVHDEKSENRQEIIKNYLGSRMAEFCLDKSACRVVQCALENLDHPLAYNLVQLLPRDSRLISICIDQNANHVIQKVASVIPLQKWEFIVDFIAQSENLREICSDKYGCRVVQAIIEKLNLDSMNNDLTITAQNQRERALQRLMSSVLSRCSELAINEYANYIIQHIVSHEHMSIYRESIIEKCLMRNLLSLSQEKFASHVVEKAFLHAPLSQLSEMMDEIFDGYIPHPETGKDALDIMMFHQFGNYVVQCMLTICCEAVTGRRETKEGSYDYISSFKEWLSKLNTRVVREKHRLAKFSSGKKMIETLNAWRMDQAYNPKDIYRYNSFTTASEEEFSKSDDEMSVQLEKKKRVRKVNQHHDDDGDDEREGNSP